MTTIWILVVIWTGDLEPTRTPEWTVLFDDLLKCRIEQRKVDNPPVRRAVCIAAD